MKVIKKLFELRPYQNKGSARLTSTLSELRGFSAGLLVVGLALLTGCAINPPADTQDYGPTMPLPPVPTEQMNGSLFQETRSLVLFEDARARRIGDILTIVLVEETSATKKASTSTNKDTSVDLGNPTILGKAVNLSPLSRKGFDMSLANAYDTNQKFGGAGDSSLSNALDGKITVTIADVLANGYLIVKGEKRLTINQGNEYIKVSGIVRPNDVRPDNTVISTLVADARITYTGDGDVAESTRMGAVSRFFNKWWPF